MRLRADDSSRTHVTPHTHDLYGDTLFVEDFASADLYGYTVFVGDFARGEPYGYTVCYRCFSADQTDDETPHR